MKAFCKHGRRWFEDCAECVMEALPALAKEIKIVGKWDDEQSDMEREQERK